MLMLTAFIEVLPIDRAPIRAALTAVVAATRAEEGCEEYGCYEDTQQLGRFVFVERWRDKAALDRHLATQHMADWMKAAGPKLKGARGFVYDVSSWTELKPE
jgi:quinol monooxygenase YgiN